MLPGWSKPNPSQAEEYFGHQWTPASMVEFFRDQWNGGNDWYWHDWAELIVRLVGLAALSESSSTAVRHDSDASV
jgi:hypothetical protein